MFFIFYWTQLYLGFDLFPDPVVPRVQSFFRSQLYLGFNLFSTFFSGSIFVHILDFSKSKITFYWSGDSLQCTSTTRSTTLQPTKEKRALDKVERNKPFSLSSDVFALIEPQHLFSRLKIAPHEFNDAGLCFHGDLMNCYRYTLCRVKCKSIISYKAKSGLGPMKVFLCCFWSP